MIALRPLKLWLKWRRLKWVVRSRLQKVMDWFPNEYNQYPCWMVWLLVAGVKTWVYSSLHWATVFYWNREAWMEKPRMVLMSREAER
jgi:hypothetical protein